MAYQIKNTNGNILTSVPDTQLVSTYGGLSLIGKDYAGFGTTLNTNLVRMAENFANSTPPSNPFIGQIWFDTVSDAIKFWDGTTFKSISVITAADTAPLNPIEGDEWLDLINLQLYVWSGTEWILIGPPSNQGAGKEGFIVAPAINTPNGNVIYLELYANNNLMAIVSSEEIIQPGIGGFGNIRPGLNFATAPTYGITESGIYNLTELTLGDNDQIDFSIDSNNNMVMAVDNGNVMYATNGNSLLPGEFANLTGTVYFNNVVANSLVAPAPGTDGDFLFNSHGAINATPVLTIDSTRTNINVENNLTAGKLVVSGATTLNSNLSVDGPSVLSSQLDVIGIANLENQLIVGGNTTLSGTLGVTGSLTVDGLTSLLNPLNVSGVTTLYEQLNVTGNATFSSDLIVNNAAIINGQSFFIGNALASNNLTVNGKIIGEGTLDITGVTTINSGTSGAFSLPSVAGIIAGSALLTNANGTTQWGNMNLNFNNHLLATNGYQVFPGGLILQWMTGSTELSTSARGPFTEQWPLTFPNNCFLVLPSTKFDNYVSDTGWQGTSIYLNGPGNYTSTINLWQDLRGDGESSSTFRVLLIGIGN